MLDGSGLSPECRGSRLCGGIYNGVRTAEEEVGWPENRCPLTVNKPSKLYQFFAESLMTLRFIFFNISCTPYSTGVPLEI